MPVGRDFRGELQTAPNVRTLRGDGAAVMVVRDVLAPCGFVLAIARSLI